MTERAHWCNLNIECFVKLKLSASRHYQEIPYTNVVDFQAVYSPCTIDPVQYISHSGCSVIEWIEDSSTNPARKSPRQSIQLDIGISLLTDATTHDIFVSYLCLEFSISRETYAATILMPFFRLIWNERSSKGQAGDFYKLATVPFFRKQMSVQWKW